MANFGLMVLASCVMTAAWLFLGKTHSDELERVWSSARMMVVEVLFSLTVFREELTIWTLYRFALLLAAKYIHELLDARMDNVSDVVACLPESSVRHPAESLEFVVVWLRLWLGTHRWSAAAWRAGANTRASLLACSALRCWT